MLPSNSPRGLPAWSAAAAGGQQQHARQCQHTTTSWHAQTLEAQGTQLRSCVFSLRPCTLPARLASESVVLSLTCNSLRAGHHAQIRDRACEACEARTAVLAVWASWTSTPRPVVLRVVFEVVPDLHASSRSCRCSADVVVQQEPSKGSSDGPAMHQ